MTDKLFIKSDNKNNDKIIQSEKDKQQENQSQYLNTLEKRKPENNFEENFKSLEKNKIKDNNPTEISKNQKNLLQFFSKKEK